MASCCYPISLKECFYYSCFAFLIQLCKDCFFFGKGKNRKLQKGDRSVEDYVLLTHIHQYGLNNAEFEISGIARVLTA